MGNADKQLRFKLLPCPKCGAKITVDNIQDLDGYGGGFGILHDCPAPLTGKGVYCYGDNVRMTVHNWNKYAKELTA